MSRTWPFLAAVLWLALAGAARAETWAPDEPLDPNSAIMGYFNSRPHVYALYKTAVEFDRRLGIVCEDKYTVIPLSSSALETIDFAPGAEHPARGVWTSRFSAERCGDTKIYNAMMTARTDSYPQITLLVPGTTGTSPRLMSDALKAVAGAAYIKNLQGGGVKDCRDIAIFDTDITDEQPDMSGGGWDERWTVRLCGDLVAIGIRFTPDGKGGTNFQTFEE